MKQMAHRGELDQQYLDLLKSDLKTAYLEFLRLVTRNKHLEEAHQP